MTDINVPPRGFKAGENVVCLNCDIGEVVEINVNSELPVVVKFKNISQAYTNDGKLFKASANRCLFHADEYVQVTVKRNIADPVEYKMQNLESKIEALEELIKHAVIIRIKKYKGFKL